MNLKKSIRRILREESNIPRVILRRVTLDELDKIFERSLDENTEDYENPLAIMYGQPYKVFAKVVIDIMISELEGNFDIPYINDEDEYIKKYREPLLKHYAPIIKDRYMDITSNNIDESITRILREETAIDRIVNMIDNEGLLHTLKVMNISFTRLFSIFGNEWLTRKIQIKFIKDLMELREYGFGLIEVGLEPIFYNENEDEYRQIDYIGQRGVTIDVIPKNNNRPDGEWFQSYFGLDDRIINELFDAMVHAYEEHPDFFR